MRSEGEPANGGVPDGRGRQRPTPMPPGSEGRARAGRSRRGSGLPGTEEEAGGPSPLPGRVNLSGKRSRVRVGAGVSVETRARRESVRRRARHGAALCGAETGSGPPPERDRARDSASTGLWRPRGWEGIGWEACRSRCGPLRGRDRIPAASGAKSAPGSGRDRLGGASVTVRPSAGSGPDPGRLRCLRRAPGPEGIGRVAHPSRCGLLSGAETGSGSPLQR